jgi:Rrf2 family protein
MMELAAHYGRGPVPVETIARNQEISGKYIHTLALGLKSAGLVRAVRGPSGGYELARDPSTITALEAVSALEGQLAPVECVADSSVCPRAPRCAAHDLWRGVKSAVDGVLSGLTLEELAMEARSKQGKASGRSGPGAHRGTAPNLHRENTSGS